MGNIEEINKELAKIHFILSGKMEISPLKLMDNEKLDYSHCGKGDDGGIVYCKTINPDEYYPLLDC